MSGTRMLVVLSYVAMAGAALVAQTASTPLSSLTIAQAVDEAIAHNLSLFAERASLSIAEAASITARLRPNPVFSFSADHLDLLGTHFDASNNGGPPEVAWRVDVPIERGGKREARMVVASIARSAAEAQVAEFVRVLKQDVTLACVDLLAAKATRALVADNLRTFQDLARVNAARAAARSTASFESTRSQVAMLQFRSTVVRAELDLAAAAARLRTLLGRAPLDPIDITDDLTVADGLAATDVTPLEQLALVSRPDLQALQRAEARTAADLRLQEAIGKVDYSVGAEYRRQQGIAGKSNSLGFFFSTAIPFSNRNQGEIARAGAEHEQTGRQIAARRAAIVSEVGTAYHEYVTTKDLVSEMKRDLLTPATSAREISAYTYRAGGSTLLELLDAQRAFNDTMQSYLDAQANLRRAASRLNAAVATEVVP
jgi:outer membrane protein, heavy metal efflux system